MRVGTDAPTRGSYAHFRKLQTRWMDNDVYGHVNNVQYYSFFDTTVNAFLIENGQLDFRNGETIGLVVETHCQFKAPIAFPEMIDAGLRVARIGSSSVRYEIGLFREHLDELCAFGHFVHVYVGRDTRRPVPLGEAMRRTLASLA